MSDFKVVQYGRSWWAAYTSSGRFLASGRTLREALEKAERC